MAISGQALATNLGINGAVCIVCIIVFSILRIKPFTRKFYSPKRFDHEVKKKPAKLPNGILSWIPPVMMYPEDEVLLTAGMDVVVLARLLLYGWLLFAFCTFWCCALLMPLNGTAGFLFTQSPDTYSNLDLLSSSNIPPSGTNNHRFWAHLFSGYLVTFVALGLLQAFSNDISRLRARYMSILPRGGTSHSVLVTDIPCVDGYGTEPGLMRRLLNKSGMEDTAMKDDKQYTPRSSMEGYPPIDDDILDPWVDSKRQLAHGRAEDLVQREMETTYGGGSVAAVNVVYNTGKVDPLFNKYNNSKRQLEDITDDYIGKIRRNKAIKRKQVSLNAALAPKWAKEKYNVGVKSVKVDALEYLPLEMEYNYQEIRRQLDTTREGYEPAAFVTFNERYKANTAATGLHCYDETAWRIQAAPGSEEIIWGNLSMRYNHRVARTVGMWALFVALLIFYVPITAAIQAVVNLDNVRNIPGLGLVTRIPFITQVLQGILPGLVLTIFLAILPLFLSMMARFEGKISLSQVDFSVVSRYYIFQVFATFIFQFLIGTLMGNITMMVDIIRDFAENPGKLVPLLGVSAVQTSSFFMSFIMIRSLALGMALLRVVPLVIFIVLSKLAGTERAKYRLWAKQPFWFGPAVANHAITILLGLSFTCLAPLIAPFCLLYFTLALLSQKYQLIYVVTLPYDSTGRMWMTCFHQIMTGVYFLQAMLLCVLLVKKFPYALLILPLIVVTVVFHVVNSKLFKRPWDLMSLKEAAVLDARDQSAITGTEAEAVRQNYMAPVFKIDDEEHRRVLHDAEQVDKQLNGSSQSSKLDIEDIEAPEEDVA